VKFDDFDEWDRNGPPGTSGTMPKDSVLRCKTAAHDPYGDLAKALGLKSPLQKWNTVLNPISQSETMKTGADLTLVVVYASGPAKGLGRFFANVPGGVPPGTTLSDPHDAQQRAAYRRELERVFDPYATETC
jgi:hypothetical protein